MTQTRTIEVSTAGMMIAWCGDGTRANTPRMSNLRDAVVITVNDETQKYGYTHIQTDDRAWANKLRGQSRYDSERPVVLCDCTALDSDWRKWDAQNEWGGPCVYWP
jgi:hypothetical protein